MTQQYLLIDGKNLLFRAGYANSNLRTSDGRYSGAIHGFIKMLHRLRIQFPDAEFVVLWEQAGQTTYRHKIFAGYKDRSKSTQSDSVLARGILAQIEGLRVFCSAVGMRWVEHRGIEADDLAGLLSKSLTTAGHEVVLHSGDCDWWQLAAVPRVSVLCEQGTARAEMPFVSDERVREKFGCHAKDLVRLRPFLGDTSDKIPPIKSRFMKRNALELVRLGVNPRLAWGDQPQPVQQWPGLAALWPAYVQNYKLMRIVRIASDCSLTYEDEEKLLTAVLHSSPVKNYRAMVQVLADWELNEAMSKRSFLFSLADVGCC
jgi:hypothetical protein